MSHSIPGDGDRQHLSSRNFPPIYPRLLYPTRQPHHHQGIPSSTNAVSYDEHHHHQPFSWNHVLTQSYLVHPRHPGEYRAYFVPTWATASSSSSEVDTSIAHSQNSDINVHDKDKRIDAKENRDPHHRRPLKKRPHIDLYYRDSLLQDTSASSEDSGVLSDEKSENLISKDMLNPTQDSSTFIENLHKINVDISLSNFNQPSSFELLTAHKGLDLLSEVATEQSNEERKTRTMIELPQGCKCPKTRCLKLYWVSPKTVLFDSILFSILFFSIPVFGNRIKIELLQIFYQLTALFFSARSPVVSKNKTPRLQK